MKKAKGKPGEVFVEGSRMINPSAPTPFQTSVQVKPSNGSINASGSATNGGSVRVTLQVINCPLSDPNCCSIDLTQAIPLPSSSPPYVYRIPVTSGYWAQSPLQLVAYSNVGQGAPNVLKIWEEVDSGGGYQLTSVAIVPFFGTQGSG
jgi:hypothetical protein